MNKLMILDENKQYGRFSYRIACHCEDNECDLEFDIWSDTTENPIGSGKYEVMDWNISFYTYRQHYGSYWKRVWTAIKMLFGYNKLVLHCFMLDKDNVEAIQYVLNKYREIGDWDSNNRNNNE